MDDKRVALVTGGNRGLGFEIARQLASRGYATVLGCRDAAKGAEAANALRAGGASAASVVLDVDDDDSTQAAVAEVIGDFGRIDVLVNNAGILLEQTNPSISKLQTTAPSVAARTFNTNSIGALRTMQAVLPGMAERNFGRVVTISSRAGQLSDMRPGLVGYRMSKAALNILTRAAAAEYRDNGIKINAMCPGWIRTEMGGSAAPVSVEDGAKTAIWLATLPPDGPTGGFFRAMVPIDW